MLAKEEAGPRHGGTPGPPASSDLRLRGRRHSWANACFGMLVGLGACSLEAGAATAFKDAFDYPDGLVTNEYAHWNSSHSDAVVSNLWDMTSGSLFAQTGTGWTGNPDSCSPNATSSNCTDSNVFRANTKKTFAGNVRVSFAIRQNKEIHDAGCESKGTCWHGTHIWLRYVNQYNLYYASIQRADGKVVIKRKVPCGSDNSGTYFEMSSYIPHDWSIGNWKHYSASIGTNADGSVTVKLYDDDQSTTVPVATGIDKGGSNSSWSSNCTTEGHYPGAAYTPITQAGGVGMRGDFANFNVDNFTVTTDDTATAEITSPVNGASVTGTVKIVGSVSDSQYVSHVNFYANGALLGTSTIAPYSYNWNTGSVASGSYTLTARAVDMAGNTGTASQPITVKVASTSLPPPDIVAPAASITAPAGGSTVSGKVNVAANATDAVGVTKVEFYVNDVLKFTDTTASYVYAWDTSAVPNGVYPLRVKAYDAAGNVGTSAVVPVTVSNQSMGTSPGLTVTQTTTSSWDGGYCQNVVIKNTTSGPITWKAALTMTGTATSIWDAVGTQSGSKLNLSGANWNAVVKAGATVTAGFCAKR
jgi:hypothetical protein